MISNPIWVVQTSQAVRTLDFEPANPSHLRVVVKKLSFIETVQHILARDGVGAFWRGIGPALVLVVNPVLQYTVFEQLKNILIKKRTAKLRATGLTTVVAVLTDRDFFILGALSKLGTKTTWVLFCLLLTFIFSCYCKYIPIYVCFSSANTLSSNLIFISSVVKSRMQAGHANALKYKSSLDGLLMIIQVEGVEGLYKGVGSKLVQSVLTAAILFAGQRRIYELMKAASVCVIVALSG